ncbi:hypothetical protein MMPV_002843 [Pyropia vietnamensis]
MAGSVSAPPPNRLPLIAVRLGRLHPRRRVPPTGRPAVVALRGVPPPPPPPPPSPRAAPSGGSFLVGARVNLFASATARAVSIIATYPIDTLKTRMQAATAPLSIPTAASAGPLYAGAGSALVTNIPYGALTFGLYETLRGALNDAAAAAPGSPIGQLPSMARTVIAAVVGDVTGSLWLTPGELIKQKVQAGWPGGALGVARRMWAQGGVGAFYQGYSSQVARDVPFRVIQLVTYEELRRLYLAAKVSRAPPSKAAAVLSASTSAVDAAKAAGSAKVAITGVEGMLLGAVAGSFTAAVTTPLDVVKTRMMTAEAGVLTGGVPGVVRQVLREEGVRGLARGLGPRVIYIGPSCAIFFAVFEGVKGHLRRGKEGGGKVRV